jgi:adenine-specific DNA-methyltransferase
LLSAVEQKRLHVGRNTEAKKKSQLGQFLTPERLAVFMASLFSDLDGSCRLLDAGAGIGSLSVAFLERWQAKGFHFDDVRLDAFEIDCTLHTHLRRAFKKYEQREKFRASVLSEDFILASTRALSANDPSGFVSGYTHVILNPPYKKLNSDSVHRLALRRVGIETVNLYSAFVALAVAMTAPGGQIVTIIPRSFCNGPYYRPFREFILERASVSHIHLFGSRNQAFKDDHVLQENIVIKLERGGKQGAVTISTSTDDAFADLASQPHPFDRIVFPYDSERFIHIPTSPEKSFLELSPAIRHTLDDLGVKVSTGPVVDFRLKAHLRNMPDDSTVPLLYPGHFSGQRTTWPIEGMKKPNAIECNVETMKWLYPNGFYCVVRRFSTKEEKRRLVASVVEPAVFGSATKLGFENHLNLLHANKEGLPEPLARGLAVYLNTTVVDEYFRRFNGHTQVNATDLRRMKYPSREMLIRLGKWAGQQATLTQDTIDAKLKTLTT